MDALATPRPAGVTITDTSAVAWTPLTGTAHSIALEVLLDGPLARSELARRLDLSPGTLTRLSKPLLDSGLLQEIGEASDPVTGRPTRPMDVDETSHLFVGVKLTATTVHVVLTSLRATVLDTAEAELPDRTPDAVVATVVDLVRSVVAGHPEHAGSLRAVGVALGGLVGEHGHVLNASFLGWQDVPLGPVLEAELDLPVVVDNDLLSFTRAEQWFGSARRCGHFAVLTIGEGLGYGLVVRDEVLDRPDAGVGLLGHYPLLPGGPLCPAGHLGCADALLTVAAVQSRASVALRRAVGYEEVLDLAAAGDPLARRVVDDSAYGLGVLVAAVGNLTMPEMVILSGEGIRLALVGEDALHRGIAEHRSSYATDLDLVVQPTGFTEWARGAAVTAIRTFVLGHRR
ncbi:ROK family transcriptional regulator [Kineococcus rhizosphaerae]|uniref:Putative NBD/HSP70 family sugar kinase n=1 Tax=Kineococcus rhizosphaerae TaxID=559628 RepID=A0A2T0R7M2_9ACTN|nr:ROK family transcriptional regulator [Kineococcus rhizosphaerae]PRY17169.1 putative NBD/HSP70 family sugar kinase [Kineococcus rhizosphaerae]